MELMFWIFTALDPSKNVQPATAHKINNTAQSEQQQKVLLKWWLSTFKPARH